jgi:hypothetical protein
MKNTVILVTRAGLGNTPDGDEAFGVEMLDTFFHTLEQQQVKPSAICLYTEAVTLLKAGSPVLMGLHLLERLGVRIVACKTCLVHYEMGTDIPVGQCGTMVDIVQLLAEADKVIRI